MRKNHLQAVHKSVNAARPGACATITPNETLPIRRAFSIRCIRYKAILSDLIETDRATSFRFPVTWAALVDSPAPLLVSQTVPVVAPRTAPRDPGLQWAMVVPKFAPPAAPTRLLAPAVADETPRFDAPKYVVP